MKFDTPTKTKWTPQYKHARTQLSLETGSLHIIVHSHIGDSCTETTYERVTHYEYAIIKTIISETVRPLAEHVFLICMN